MMKKISMALVTIFLAIGLFSVDKTKAAETITIEIARDGNLAYSTESGKGWHYASPGTLRINKACRD